MTSKTLEAKGDGQQSPTFNILENKTWRLIRFALITGIIFIALFLVMNAQAYKSILVSTLNPEKVKQTGQILEGSTEGKGINLVPLMNKSEVGNTYVWLDFPVVPTDNRLVIPKLAKSVPIVETGAENLEGKNWTELEKQIQSSLQNGVLHYPNTAVPGQYGNVFITGHSSYYLWDSGSYKDVFANLYKLEIGDEYYVYYKQKKYTYKIVEKNIISPNDTTVLEQPKDKLISSLMTCYPTGFTTSRLVITAEQQ